MSKRDLDTRTFQEHVFNWQYVTSPTELAKKIEAAKVWAKWAEHKKTIQNMQNRLEELRHDEYRSLVKRYGYSRNGHAIFAPSSAHQWMACSGSLLANLEAGDTAGIDAAMGTVAHAIAEEWNKTGQEPRHLLGSEMSAMAGGRSYTFTIDQEWLDNARKFVEWIAEVPGDQYFEQKVDISPLTPIPEQRGTMDSGVFAPGVATITDLKNGMIRHYAERHPQAMLYAAGAFLEWDWMYGFERIVIRICHPRLDVFDVWECSRQELLDFMETVKVRAAAAWTYDAPRTPGEKQCIFCAAKAKCPARLSALEDLLDSTFSGEEPPTSYTGAQVVATAETTKVSIPELDKKRLPQLSTLVLEKLLFRRKEIEGFLKAVYEHLLERAENGEKLSLWKLGEGRQTHEWSDEQKARKAILQRWGASMDESDLFEPPAMLSIDKMKKAIRKMTDEKPSVIVKSLQIDKLISDFAGKRGLIPVEDGRADFNEVIDDVFGDDDEL